MAKQQDCDFVIAGIDDVDVRGAKGFIDITGADDLEIRIKDDGTVLWINGPGNLVRICTIRGKITIQDDRLKGKRRSR